MKLLIYFCFFLILSGCASNIITREPAAYSPTYSCSKMVNLFFSKLDTPEIKILNKDSFKIVKSEIIERHEFSQNLERFLEIEGGAIIDLHALTGKIFQQIKDSLGTV